MTFAETLDFLYRQLPMYQRVGPKAFKKNLTNIRLLAEALGNPHQHFSSIHIAGTNGKGSVSNLLAATLQAAGFKVGLYTSPHLRSFRERIRINGQEIPERAVVDFVAGNLAQIEEIKPSFFELSVAMAFEHFHQEAVDIAVVEVGLGGRLDSTNILEPIVGAITNISFDHMGMLGDTLPLIAGEKAGIFKSGRSFVIGEFVDQTRPVFENKAEEVGAQLVFAEEKYALGKWVETIDRQQVGFSEYMQDMRCFDLPLGGAYQMRNLRTVLCLLDELDGLGYPVSEAQIQDGLRRVTELTGFRGRMSILGRAPWIVTDVGHNPAGVRQVISALERFPKKDLHMVWGSVFDKELDDVLELLPQEASYYFVKPDVPRGLDAVKLAAEARRFDLLGETYPSVQAGLDAAKAQAQPEDLIFVGGSTFVVAEII